MKIVHVSYWENQGGAAIAANRLHKAMLEAELDSFMLVVNKSTEDKRVYSLLSGYNRIKLRFLSILSSRLLAKYRPILGLFSINRWGLSIIHHPLVKDADIVYIHWINNSMICFDAIRYLIEKKKVVFYLHDMNHLTGGCHHSFGCDNYKFFCGNCKVLNSNREKDISHWQLQMKYNSYKNNELNVVAPSRWMADCASQSMVYRNANIKVIPNFIFINSFHANDKYLARKSVGLPLNEKLILFGADCGIKNPYKGWRYLKEALLMSRINASLVIFGGDFEDNDIKSVYRVFSMGRINDVSFLNNLYSACDVFVMPSLAETFGQTALESIASGTPVVAFDVGGLPDIVLHRRNGYLATLRSSEKIRDGIEWCLKNENFESEYFIDYVLDNFSSTHITALHIDLLNSLF